MVVCPWVDAQGLHLDSETSAKMQTLKVHRKYKRRVWGTLYRIWRRGAMLKILWSGSVSVDVSDTTPEPWTRTVRAVSHDSGVRNRQAEC
jgi:hypothetical protein